MTKSVKNKPPSRVRYEQAHPTVSCRISRKIYDRLQIFREIEGRSFADILKVGLGMLEVHAEKKAELAEKGLKAGCKKGYADAESAFKIIYPCNVCREALTVESRDEKKAIRVYMHQNGWGHSECHERIG